MPYAELNDISTYYEQHGAGEPVLLLHGGFCSLETWQAQIDALAPSFRVHAPERPGQGRTADRDGPFTYAAMVTDTLAYLDHAGLGSAHVVGFSDGAIIGLILAADHPARVRSLVAISGNLDPDCLVPGEPVAEAPGVEEQAQVDGADDEEEDEEWAAVRAAYDRLSPDGPGHGEVVLEKLMTLWTTEPRIDPADLAAITAPTLVLAGDGDSIPTPHTELIARSIPGARLVIVPDAGHMVMQQRPDAVNDAVTGFLAGT